MNFEEQLLIGGLLMAMALFSASHAHARHHRAAVPVARIAVNLPSPGPR